LVVLQSIWASEQAFERDATEVQNQITDRALIAETSLEGFAAFVMSQTDLDHTAAADYARTLLARYPFLYMFEVAERVTRDQRPAVETRIASLYPGFQIRRFAYLGDRRWQTAPDAATYFPIIFQEPYFSDERMIVGLDLFSSDFLVEAMRRSFNLGMPMASSPFELAEGVTGYVIHRALNGNLAEATEPLTAPRYALLALRADWLFGDIARRYPWIAIRLGQTAPEGEQPAMRLLLDSPGQPANEPTRWLLPRFEQITELRVDVPSHPFQLTLQRQMRWEDLNLPLIAGLLLIMITAPVFARRFAVAYFENRLARLDSEGVLYQMANFDALTGAANRHRLTEQLELTILRAERDKAGFCLLFVDIDQFRRINDRFGHAAGDAALVEFCERLQGLLRADEMLGRLGGDEFVLVTGTAVSPLDIPALIERVRAAFDAPIRYQRQSIPLHVSIGHACFPRDGRNISALLGIADRRMYSDKQRKNDPPNSLPG
jgi:diguanylate cyclase (GGDEF)-like protein